MQYSNFVAEDFCKDAYFIRWATSPDKDSDQFWRSFTEMHPDKTNEVELALEYISTMRFHETHPSDEDLTTLKARIWKDLYEQPQSVKPLPIWRYAVAASIIFLLVFGSWLTFRNKPSTNYRTDFGQISELILEDGSRVTLNARSELTVGTDLGKNKVREVWLQGEAFFEISKRAGAKFVVHTPQTRVEVLGTEFNVNTRRKQTQVVLSTGKVQLFSGHSPALIMKPGDMATVSNKIVHFKRVSPDHYDSWKQSFMIMDDKPVSEIAELIQDSYGIRLQFENPALLNRKLSGKLFIKNPHDFLENLSTILQTELTKTDDGYLFR